MKKEMIAAGLMVFLLPLLVACEAVPDSSSSAVGQEEGVKQSVPVQPVLESHRIQEVDEEDNLLCSAEWDSLTLSEESAAVYPALDAALRERNGENERYSEEFLREMLPDAREFVMDRAGDFGGLTRTSRYTVQRADEHILSVRMEEYEYTGGAHGNYGSYGLNLNPATGEQRKLTEVLTGIEPLPVLLTEKIRAENSPEEFPCLLEQLEGYEESQYNWTTDSQGITFYFNPYEISPYEVGLLTAAIAFEELPELFAEAYIPAEDGVGTAA